jgi:hypothetical protein
MLLLLNLCRFATDYDAIILSITHNFLSYVATVLNITRLFDSSKKFTPLSFRFNAITLPVKGNIAGNCVALKTDR